MTFFNLHQLPIKNGIPLFLSNNLKISKPFRYRFLFALSLTQTLEYNKCISIYND